MEDFWGLYRSADDAKVAGVCSGLAERWRVDPLIIRLGMVLAILSSGIGLVIYIGAALVLPTAAGGQSYLERVHPPAREWPRRTVIAAIGITALVIAIVMGSIFPLSWMPLLVIAGAWFFGHHLPKQRADQQAAEQRAALPAEQSGVRAEGFQHAGAGVQAPQAQPAARQQQFFPHYRPPAAGPQNSAPVRDHLAGLRPGDQPRPLPPVVAPPTRPQPSAEQLTPTSHISVEEPEIDDIDTYMRRQRHETPAPGSQQPATADRSRRKAPRGKGANRCRWFTLAAMALSVVALVVISLYGIHVPVAIGFAVPAAIGALGLIVGTWVGRGRGLMSITVILTIAALVALSPAYVDVDGAIEDFQATEPVVYTEAPDDITSTVTDIQADFSQITLTDDERVDIRSELGDVTVWLPDDVTVEIEARSEVGQLSNTVTGERITDASPSATWTFPATDPDAPVLTIAIHSTVGNVEVRR